jgi:hypothetical protein
LRGLLGRRSKSQRRRGCKYLKPSIGGERFALNYPIPLAPGWSAVRAQKGPSRRGRLRPLKSPSGNGRANPAAKFNANRRPAFRMRMADEHYALRKKAPTTGVAEAWELHRDVPGRSKPGGNRNSGDGLSFRLDRGLSPDGRVRTGAGRPGAAEAAYGCSPGTNQLARPAERSTTSIAGERYALREEPRRGRMIGLAPRRGRTDYLALRRCGGLGGRALSMTPAISRMTAWILVRSLAWDATLTRVRRCLSASA